MNWPKRARTMVQQDQQGAYRLRYSAAMAALNLARFGSGLVSTPLRILQEKLLKGEELICIARPRPSRSLPAYTHEPVGHHTDL